MLGALALVVTIAAAEQHMPQQQHYRKVLLSGPASRGFFLTDGPSGPAADEQWFYIIRHTDKYSSYPKCGSPGRPDPCFNQSLMGNNPPLTPCGVTQSTATAAWLQKNATVAGGIHHIVSSPYARSLETALPLAGALGLGLNVDNLVGEARNSDAPFRPDNVGLSPSTVGRLKDASAKWSVSYGSAPIPVPETDALYTARVMHAGAELADRFPAGNVAIFTHATTSFSLAYGGPRAPNQHVA